MIEYIITMRDGSVIRGQTKFAHWVSFCDELTGDPWAHLVSSENGSEYWIRTGCVSNTWSKPV